MKTTSARLVDILVAVSASSPVFDGFQRRTKGRAGVALRTLKPLLFKGFWPNQAAGVGFEPTSAGSGASGFQDRR
jgi:hypothetical protein